MGDNENCLFTSLVEHQNKQHALTLTKYNLIWEASQGRRLSDNNAFDPLLRKFLNCAVFVYSCFAVVKN